MNAKPPGAGLEVEEAAVEGVEGADVFIGEEGVAAARGGILELAAAFFAGGFFLELLLVLRGAICLRVLRKAGICELLGQQEEVGDRVVP